MSYYKSLYQMYLIFINNKKVKYIFKEKHLHRTRVTNTSHDYIKCYSENSDCHSNFVFVYLFFCF